MNKNKKRDPIAEVRKSKKFPLYKDESRVKVNLAIEIFEARKLIGMTQKELAKKVGTTQRVISNIENGEVNPGLDLINRLIKQLHLSTESLGQIFCTPYKMPLSAMQSDNASPQLEDILFYANTEATLSLL